MFISLRIFTRLEVSHTDEEIEDELNIVVDNGGCVVDVFIDHEITEPSGRLWGSIRGGR